MRLEPLPFDAPLHAHAAAAEELLAAFRARDADALEAVRRFDPRCRDAQVAWLAREVGEAELAALAFGHDEARLVVARAHDFAEWSALAELAAAVAAGGAVARFERAVEHVVDGELDALERLLAEDKSLARARSKRRTCFDPPLHGATLLHYVAANGVEGARQRTPPNAPAIVRALFAAGAEADARAGFYGQSCATLGLLVSSSVPAAAGLQGELVELLLDHGAVIEGQSESCGSPLLTALLFGCDQAVAALVRRGARTDDLAIAAGLGRARDVAHLLPTASAARRHLALSMAAQLGHAEALGVLLAAGEDPSRFNPAGAHAHATPLHQAALGGHLAALELLLAHGARLDLADKIYRSTPLAWARHAGQTEAAERLARAQGAR